MRPFPPIAFFTLFCLGTLAVVGYVVAASNGLSELHKTILVAFLVAFPSLTMLIFLSLLPKADTTETTPFRSRNAEPTAEPMDLTPMNRV